MIKKLIAIALLAFGLSVIPNSANAGFPTLPPKQTTLNIAIVTHNVFGQPIDPQQYVVHINRPVYEGEPITTVSVTPAVCTLGPNQTLVYHSSGDCTLQASVPAHTSNPKATAGFDSHSFEIEL